jgi:subtilisin family serine protease
VFGTITPTGCATVALLDTGVDASHQELVGKVVPGGGFLSTMRDSIDHSEGA